MGKFTLVGSLMIGAVLVTGQRFFPDFTVMWFASLSAGALLWREALLVGLLATALIKEYYDSELLRLVWGVLALGLILGGVEYFMYQPAFIFDALFMLSAGVYFGISSLQLIPPEAPAYELPGVQEQVADRAVTKARAAAAAMAWSQSRQHLAQARKRAGAWAGLARVSARTQLQGRQRLAGMLPASLRHEGLQDGHMMRLPHPPMHAQY